MVRRSNCSWDGRQNRFGLALGGWIYRGVLVRSFGELEFIQHYHCDKSTDTTIATTKSVSITLTIYGALLANATTPSIQNATTPSPNVNINHTTQQSSMCCRNGPRRQPLAITLGQFACRKYQERKQQQKQIEATGAANRLERRASPPPHVLEREANGEILEKAGMAPPPSYNDAVDSPSSPKVSLKRVSSDEDEDDLSDAESFFEFDAEGKRQGSSEIAAAQAGFVSRWRANRGGVEMGEGGEKPVLSKWQQTRAEWAIRKAERAARRADRAAIGL